MIKKIAKLRLKGMLENLDSVVKQTAEKNLDPWTALSILADLEIEQRLQKLSGAPLAAVKT